MKNLRKNKKLLVTVIAGILLLTAAIGAYTFAWLTSQQAIAGGNFDVARVELQAADGEYGAYNFLPNNLVNLEYQSALEGFFGANQNAAFAAWLKANSDPAKWASSTEYAQMLLDYDAWLDELWNVLEPAVRQAEIDFAAAFAAYSDMLAAHGIAVANEPVYSPPVRSDFQAGIAGTLQYNIALNTYNTVTWPVLYGAWELEVSIRLGAVTLTDNLAAQFKAAEDAARNAFYVLFYAIDALNTEILSKGVYYETDLVAPGSIIYGRFDLANTSNVDTYFRISTPTLAALGSPILHSAVAVYSTGQTVTLVAGDDGFLYCPEVLEVGEDIAIVIGAYLFGKENVNWNFGNDYITISNASVELIQASNNAANFEWLTSAGFSVGFFR